MAPFFQQQRDNVQALTQLVQGMTHYVNNAPVVGAHPPTMAAMKLKPPHIDFTGTKPFLETQASVITYLKNEAKKFGIDPNLVVLDVFNLKILHHGTVAVDYAGTLGDMFDQHIFTFLHANSSPAAWSLVKDLAIKQSSGHLAWLDMRDEILPLDANKIGQYRVEMEQLVYDPKETPTAFFKRVGEICDKIYWCGGTVDFPSLKHRLSIALWDDEVLGHVARHMDNFNSVHEIRSKCIDTHKKAIAAAKIKGHKGADRQSLSETLRGHLAMLSEQRGKGKGKGKGRGRGRGGMPASMISLADFGVSAGQLRAVLDRHGQGQKRPAGDGAGEERP